MATALPDLYLGNIVPITPFSLFTHLYSPVKIESSTLLSVLVVPLGQVLGSLPGLSCMTMGCLCDWPYKAEALQVPIMMHVCVCGLWCVVCTC